MSLKYIVDGVLFSDASHGSAEAKAVIAKWFGWTNAPGGLPWTHHLGRVVLLEDGRIAEQGTGPGLLAAGGSYAQLYRVNGHEPKELIKQS